MTPSLTPSLQDLISDPSNASLLSSPAPKVTLAAQPAGVPMLKNLIGDQTPTQDPGPMDTSLGSMPLPSIPGTLRPLVTNPRQQQEDMYQERINKLNMPDPQKPGFWHALGNVATKIGTTALGVLAPGMAELIPGDMNYTQHKSDQLQGRLDYMRGQDETLANNLSKRNLEGAQTEDASAEAGLKQRALDNPQDWSEPIATDRGYMERNSKTGEYRPAMFNGQTLSPYVKPLTNETTQPLSNAPAYQAAMADRFHQLNPGKPMPPEFILPSNATVGDYTRINAALTSLEQAQYQQQSHQDAQDNAAATRAAAAANASTNHEFAENERGRGLLDKAEAQYHTAQQSAQNIRSMIDDANAGGKVSAQMLPLEGALDITTSNGVKRINRTEVDQYSGAGALYDRIAGGISKLTKGQPFTSEILANMKRLSDILEKGAYTNYKATYDSTTKRYGLNDEKPLPGPGGQGQGAPIEGDVKTNSAGHQVVFHNGAWGYK
jgi:hypothetical protein